MNADKEFLYKPILKEIAGVLNPILKKARSYQKNAPQKQIVTTFIKEDQKYRIGSSKPEIKEKITETDNVLRVKLKVFFDFWGFPKEEEVGSLNKNATVSKLSVMFIHNAYYKEFLLKDYINPYFHENNFPLDKTLYLLDLHQQRTLGKKSVYFFPNFFKLKNNYYVRNISDSTESKIDSARAVYGYLAHKKEVEMFENTYRTRKNSLWCQDNVVTWVQVKPEVIIKMMDLRKLD